ncbi:MAG TPA: hypothetical protein VFY93_04255 [Planctomycetota bacterium]|nr:hypothetical protein [Planctomycetota bacterium]
MLRLDYGGLVIAVEGPAAPLAWLREFVGAAFDDAHPGAAGAPEHRVRVAYARPAAVRGETIEVFSLDGDFVRLPATRTPDRGLRLHDEAQGIGYELRRGEAAIVADADGPALRLALLRVAREIATAHALRAGRLHLHAAALEVDGSVVALAGRRRSGKTTLLLHALLAGGARYVTNDRLFVDLSADPPLARGMPAIVTLRDETLARFPAFAERLAASGFARERTIAESSPGTPSRPNLSPAQLRALTGAGESPGGPLRAIVLPAVDPAVPRFEIRQFAPGDAAARVRDGLFLATLPERPARAFATDAAPRDGPALDRLCADLAARVPCLDVRLGPGAYRAPAVWDAIRERVR